jgi:hypothetical protein
LGHNLQAYQDAFIYQLNKARQLLTASITESFCCLTSLTWTFPVLAAPNQQFPVPSAFAVPHSLFYKKKNYLQGLVSLPELLSA